MAKLKHPLDNIVYEKQKPAEKIHEFVTVDWENILPDPPANSSQETQNELDEVVILNELQRSPVHVPIWKAFCMEKCITGDWSDFIKQVDDNAWLVFDDFLSGGFSATEIKNLKKMVNKTWPIVRGVVVSLKRKHNRARPEQLRSDINVITTKTHQTPAYPSGHAAFGYVSAKVISLVHPSLKAKVEQVAKTVAFARVVQGVHYPSDGFASKVLVNKLWEDVGFKLFPEYYKSSTWLEKEWRKK
jgi:hypothetical protein